ncbi:glutathione S-transferase C-terminal domain-containing protein [Paenibacillus sp. HN-1]|uniref:glutathione S-transferase family protein n=1 Tax=Paenibacillus TaxID=44249 RepID=UPI001CA8FD99|nr:MULTISPECIES: glutathione S-transferase C-terminal domain-containing protein [Paenibacillus]MBY9080532.1 glutathione S-transferase C-terminal domain-containing protein [Paenibacillus sp. CGMCC 1.18879]MBY9085523.1 glutathione S-transferase C-terminal domain-containing protein [Paenibacillus sinensis]
MTNSAKATPVEISRDGSFQRQRNRFAVPFGSGPDELPVEAGRYRLLWSAACPWAHRAVIVRSLLGLEEAISLGTADPIRPDLPHTDWAFTLDEGGTDPVLGIRYLSEAYLAADPGYTGRPTVPAVVEIRTGKVVNNDYFRLTNELETAWAPFHKAGAPDLYPADLRAEIDELNERIFHDVNNGVYKAGFARSQEAYEKAYDVLFERLDELEERLSTRRYLHGNRLTDSDVRLYTTLVRFDAAYYTAFRANRRRIADYRHLWAYARDLYQTPGFGDTTDFDAIKRHYHLSGLLTSEGANPYRILPKGPDLSQWNTPHGRGR